jgi:hypothetical protein
MLSISMDELHEKALQLESKLKQIGCCDKIQAKISEGFAGGGTLPDQQMPTWVVDFSSPHLDTQALSHKLRTSQPSLFTRIKDDKIVLDLRTLNNDEIDIACDYICQRPDSPALLQPCAQAILWGFKRCPQHIYLEKAPLPQLPAVKRLEIDEETLYLEDNVLYDGEYEAKGRIGDKKVFLFEVKN